jgi:hypothetical protein
MQTNANTTFHPTFHHVAVVFVIVLLNPSRHQNAAASVINLGKL